MTGNAGVQITIDPRAVDWIQRHGGNITLRQSPRHGCCGGTALLPVAEARTPPRPDDWIVRHIDGVTAYIDRELATHAGSMTVRAEGFRQWRRLFVEATAAQP